jgi:hypothetical protein
MATRGKIALLGARSLGEGIDRRRTLRPSGVRRESGIGSRRARIPRKTEVAHYRIGAGSLGIGASPREIRIGPREFEVNRREIEGAHREVEK